MMGHEMYRPLTKKLHENRAAFEQHDVDVSTRGESHVCFLFQHVAFWINGRPFFMPKQ